MISGAVHCQLCQIKTHVVSNNLSPATRGLWLSRPFFQRLDRLLISGVCETVTAVSEADGLVTLKSNQSICPQDWRHTCVASSSGISLRGTRTTSRRTLTRTAVLRLDPDDMSSRMVDGLTANFGDVLDWGGLHRDSSRKDSEEKGSRLHSVLVEVS